MNEEQNNQATAEWTKFGILAGVLFVVVLVVALSRPLIFGRIVPAVMGEGLAAPLPPTAVPTPAPVLTPEPTAVESETDSPAPANPSPTPLVHVVRAGETLFSIARQYNVAVDALISANNLSTPDRIRVGDALIIPAP